MSRELDEFFEDWIARMERLRREDQLTASDEMFIDLMGRMEQLRAART